MIVLFFIFFPVSTPFTEYDFTKSDFERLLTVTLDGFGVLWAGVEVPVHPTPCLTIFSIGVHGHRA